MKIVCIKWGDKYGAQYVNILQSMLKRHLTVPHELLCITDDPTGVKCDCLPLEDNLTGWWPKLTLFRNNPYGINEKFLYLDLDIVIVDNIDAMAQHPGNFVIIQDWNLDMYNSSVMLIEPGSQSQIWERFSENADYEMNNTRCGDQWVTTKYAQAVHTWPTQWCVSYRGQARTCVPEGAKMVIFHGTPNPHDYPASYVSTYWR